jgi:transcriptional regulator with XRE-family HTH domain
MICRLPDPGSSCRYSGELAHDADVDRAYVGLLENGHCPSLPVIFAIAGALGISPEALVRRTWERAARGAAQDPRALHFVLSRAMGTIKPPHECETES